MKHKKLKVSTLLLLGLGILSTHAQNAVTASGGNATGNDGSVSYSVGQVVYTTSVGSAGSMEQGVQVPYVISIESVVGEVQNITLSAYPNPTTDFLILKTDASAPKTYVAYLYDATGKLLQTQKLVTTQTNIDMSKYNAAIYFVKVKDGNTEIKSFKIVKN